MPDERDEDDLDEENDLDEDDLDEEDEEPPESEDEGPAGVAVERLTDVEAWEMYRLVADDTRFPICSIALRAPAGERRVEYAVWRVKQDVDGPGATGTVEREAGDRGWDDQAREDALRQVAYRYEADLGVEQARLVFRLSPRDDEREDEGFDDAGGFEVDVAAPPAGKE